MKLEPLSSDACTKLRLAGLPETTAINALSVAFQAACAVIENAKKNEVGVTGSLRGAIETQITECAKAFATRYSPGCSWIEYQHRGPVNETQTGADFGLVIQLSPTKARIGLFQAKLDSTPKASKLKQHQMAPEMGPEAPEEPQFERLIKYGFQILHKDPDWRLISELFALGWVHYVVYGPGVCQSYSVDQMSPIKTEYERRRANGEKVDRANSMHLAAFRKRALRNLLRDGAEKPAIVIADGWFDTSAHLAKEALLDPTLTIPFYVGSPGRMPELLTTKELEKNQINRRDVAAAPPSDSAAEGPARRLDVDAPVVDKKRKPKQKG